MTRRLRTVGHVTVFALVVAISIYPILWLVSISLQRANAAYHLPPRLLFVPDFDNYARVLGDEAFVASLVDSLLVAVPATALCVICGALAGYALSRYRIRGRGALTVAFLVTRLVPAFAIVVPTFIIYRKLDLLDSLSGLVLAMAAFQVPIAILILYRSIDAIPRSLDEAARIDGAAPLTVIGRVIVPLIAPGIAATAVLTFILVWNEFLFVLLLAGDTLVTLPVTISTYETARQVLWGPIAAASVVAVLPVLILVAFTQRYLLAGLGLGAVRE